MFVDAAIPEWLVATGAGRCQGQALACRREALTLGAGEVAKTEGGWLQKVLKKRNNRGSRRLDLKFYRKTVALSTYKGMSSVELGFRFLKDPVFFASSLYLKKPSRLAALLMVMTLALLVYSIGQRRMRSYLKSKGKTLPNQVKL